MKGVVQEYVDAYSRLDVSAVKRVFPGVDEESLARVFSQLNSQTAQLEYQSVSISGATATVTGTWSVVAESKLGRPSGTTTQVTLRLERNSGTWVIVDHR